MRTSPSVLPDKPDDMFDRDVEWISSGLQLKCLYPSSGNLIVVLVPHDQWRDPEPLRDSL